MGVLTDHIVFHSNKRIRQETNQSEFIATHQNLYLASHSDGKFIMAVVLFSGQTKTELHTGAAQKKIPQKEEQMEKKFA